jgi:hypothetical protein
MVYCTADLAHTETTPEVPADAPNNIAFAARIPPVITGNPTIMGLIKSLRFDGRDVTQPNVAQFGMDGFFPISCQNLSMLALCPEKANQNGWIPAGSEVNFA